MSGPLLRSEVTIGRTRDGQSAPNYGTFWKTRNPAAADWPVWDAWCKQSSEFGPDSRIIGLEAAPIGAVTHGICWKDVPSTNKPLCCTNQMSGLGQCRPEWTSSQPECTQTIDEWCVNNSSHPLCNTVSICMGRSPNVNRAGYAPQSTRCDEFMRTYCNDPAHRNSEECACFVSSDDATNPLKSKPHCWDPVCSSRNGRAYMTAAQTRETCPDMNYQKCVQMLGLEGSQNQLTTEQRQQCLQSVEAGSGGSSAPITSTTPATPATPVTPAVPSSEGTSLSNISLSTIHPLWFVGGGVGVLVILGIIIAVLDKKK